MSKHTIVIVAADPDRDDCLAAAESDYLDEHPELRGYDLEPRWVDEADREQVALTVPVWSIDEPISESERLAAAADHAHDEQRDWDLFHGGRDD